MNALGGRLPGGLDSRLDQPPELGAHPRAVCRSDVRERPDFIESRAEPVPCDLDVVTVLKIQPEALAGPEVPREPQSRVGGDAPFAVDDLVDPARRNADRYRYAMLSDLKRL
jgi:hypothetical protein